MPSIPPLLADVEGLFKIAIGIIVFIGWIAKLVGQKQQGNAAAPAPRPRNKPVREELEAFLREAQGQGRPQPRPRPQEQEIELLSADDVEAEVAPPRTKPSGSRNKPQSSGGRRGPANQGKPKSKPKPEETRRPQPVAERPQQPSTLGASLQQHVQSHMGERVATQAGQDVNPQVAASVNSHLGSFSSDSLKEQAAPTAAGNLLTMLRSAESARQAYILTEILKPPVRVRRR